MEEQLKTYPLATTDRNERPWGVQLLSWLLKWGQLKEGGVVQKLKIISDSVIIGPRRVDVLCFSSDSDTGTARGQQSGRGARQGRIVTVVRIRQSDCRHSKQDVTYPSAGILLLPFSGRPRRGKKKKKIIQKYLLRSFLKSIRHPTRRSWCQ